MQKYPSTHTHTSVDTLVVHPTHVVHQHTHMSSINATGLYLATGGTDAKVVVWDVAARKALDSHDCPAPICCVAWDPTLNALAWSTAEGDVGLWREPVPRGLVGPAAAVDAVPMGRVASLVDDAAEDQGTQGIESCLGVVSGFE